MSPLRAEGTGRVAGSSLGTQQLSEPGVSPQRHKAGLHVRVEEANLVHISRVEGPGEQVHRRVALAQERLDAGPPIEGLPAPEGSLERDQQPVEACGLGAVTAL